MTWRTLGRSGNFEIGIALFADHRGHGVGTEAQRQLVHYLFDTTTANRLQAGTEADNVAEQRALVRAGFRREGVQRGAHFRAGRWRDSVLYGLLRDDERPSSDDEGVVHPLLHLVDAVTVPVLDLDAGLAFYAGRLGQPLRWRNDEIGAAAVGLPESATEIVLTTEHGYEPNWLVDSADRAAVAVEEAGGRILSTPVDIPVGRVAVVADPFGNALVLVDLSKGRYVTDAAGNVTEVRPDLR